MAIAEIFLGAFVQMLFEKLASGELIKFGHGEGIQFQLQKLKRMMEGIRAVLGDAEEKQITDEAVKLWLEELQDAAYDLDDLLDEFATEALRRQLTAEPRSGTSKVGNLIPNCCKTFTPSAFMFDRNMRSKIEQITHKLQGIATRKSDLNLKDNNTAVSGVSFKQERERERERLPSTSLVDKSKVYGRGEDKQALLELLLSGDDEVCFIPIVGMGGVGKTTLAQLLYNDHILGGHFELKAWACVSDYFNPLAVTKAILGALTSGASHENDLNTLQVKLKETLSGKRFLLVLDDIWNENYEDWNVLCLPFLNGAPGSKVLFTTRHESVASVMRSVPTYHLKELPNEDCLSLFAHHALGRSNFDAHPNLKEIGEQIVKKCRGLPLAAKTLGGLLRTKLDRSRWEDVLDSNIWELPRGKSHILPALRLSYYHLPSHLKPCFVYCSLFPQDYEFDKEELVLLWMAEGLLQPMPKRKKQMEDIGRECFDELLSRSFFQQSSTGDVNRFVMHDLINDLAQFVAGKTFFRLADREHITGLERVRHFSYTRQSYEITTKFKALNKIGELRTFLPVPGWKYGANISRKVLFDMLPKLHCLRVLSLFDYGISELPDSIGKLQHIRYLNLSDTSIQCLPESIGNLYNLQTLLVRSCSRLRKLPSSIANLINLRHLDNAMTFQLEEMPLGIGRLTNLQTLSKIVLGGSGSGSRLTELRKLSLLRGMLSIVGLQNITHLREVEAANLMSKRHICELNLKWSSGFDNFRNEEMEVDVLGMLKPHSNLERLEIQNYRGTAFPSWIGDPAFSKIVSLGLHSCTKCHSLPPLGQWQGLKHLHIGGMPGVKNAGGMFSGNGGTMDCPFPSLETLRFEDMSEWEEWFCFPCVEKGEQQFPCLLDLCIIRCPKLIKVPILKLPSLRRLCLSNCQDVVLTSLADLTSLTHLEAESITGLHEMQQEFLWPLVALRSLWILRCNQLVSLSRNCVALERLVCLKELLVEGCPQIVSLGEEDEGLPRNLESLSIYDCLNLEKLPTGLERLASLRNLGIIGCPKLVYGWETDVAAPAPTLPHPSPTPTDRSGTTNSDVSRHDIVEMPNCMRMSSLKTLLFDTAWPHWGMFVGCINYFAGLEELSIHSYDGVEAFPEKGVCIPNLKNLWMSSCASLRYLWANRTQSLEVLQIVGCPRLECVSENGLPIRSLRNLWIEDARNLRCLPWDGIQSLHYVEIGKCAILDSFPQHSLPPNLTKLQINANWEEKMKPMREWGLHTLTSLRFLSIEGGFPELLSFSENVVCSTATASAPSVVPSFLFPSSLIELDIACLPKLESLSAQALHNLSSLEELYIRDCPMLRSLPKEGLPSTLGCLRIINCPLLKERCSADRGDYWPIIHHIPRLYIR